MAVAVMGDLVASREADDRNALNQALVDVLEAANHGVDQQWRPVTPRRITVGNEFQGVFATLGAALRATLRIRLALTPYDVRFGLGRGDVTVLSEEPRVEDGPAWWAARHAIEVGAVAQRRAASRSVRVTYASDPVGSTDPAVAAACSLPDDLA